MKSLRSIPLWTIVLGLGAFSVLRIADAHDLPIAAFASFGSEPGDRDDDGDNLDFAHFGNGESVAFELTLVNMATEAVRPTVHFYDKEGRPIAAESVMELTEDLEARADGSVRSRMKIQPLRFATPFRRTQNQVLSSGRESRLNFVFFREPS